MGWIEDPRKGDLDEPLHRQGIDEVAVRHQQLDVGVKSITNAGRNHVAFNTPRIGVYMSPSAKIACGSFMLGSIASWRHFKHQLSKQNAASKKHCFSWNDDFILEALCEPKP